MVVAGAVLERGGSGKGPSFWVAHPVKLFAAMQNSLPSGSSHGLLSQFKVVNLSDEVVTEAVVRLLGFQDKPARQVHRPGGDERVVRVVRGDAEHAADGNSQSSPSVSSIISWKALGDMGVRRHRTSWTVPQSYPSWYAVFQK